MPPIRVRFRRGDAWLPARLRLLTEDSISIATACPPPSGSLVELELEGPSSSLHVEALIIATTPVELVDLLGVPGFGARFVHLSGDDRTVLSGLASVVRHAEGTGTRPPIRAAPRYPICWPLYLDYNDTTEPVTAYDISRDGLFIGHRAPLPPNDGLTLALPSDTGDGAIRARAHAARRLANPAAASRMLRAGYGLQVVAHDQRERQRYLELVERVARRARTNVLIGARTLEGRRISSALAAVGYVASVAPDAESLLERCAAADLVVLEDAVYHLHTRTLTLRLDATGVPWFHAPADDSRSIRAWADSIVT